VSAMSSISLFSASSRALRSAIWGGRGRGGEG
jgi:hypothetical protein